VLDPHEWIHRITAHIPDPGSHCQRFYGAYSNRGRIVCAGEQADSPGAGPPAAAKASKGRNGEYASIDQNRLYTTGQSAGCMASIAFNIKYPDLFAASLLVAGQWNFQAMAGMIHNNIWIIVSEGDQRAFPGMNAAIAVWEKDVHTLG
jgi:hypothetical protein